MLALEEVPDLASRFAEGTAEGEGSDFRCRLVSEMVSGMRRRKRR